MKTTIGIDLGGTQIKAVAINEAGDILLQRNQPTNDDGEAAWKQSVFEMIEKLQAELDEKNFMVGISAPGLPNAANTAIAFMPGRMQGLEYFVWSDFLRKPAFVLNDAVAAMMAEARFGSAKEQQHVVMLTLGTGVGGAILIHGKPYQGMFGKAGHIGHMVIDQHGEPDIIGMPGSLEDCIGNCSILKRTGGKFSSTRELLEASKAGDAFAWEVWLKSVRQLALALASITNILSPQTIVLGGGIAAAGAELFEPLQNFMNEFEWRAGGNQVQIVQASQGDMAGAIGAAAFAMQNI